MYPHQARRMCVEDILFLVEKLLFVIRDGRVG
jgi:hypothetical protein